jgi:hypothetical protein
VSAQRRKGTTWESTIVDYLRDNGFPHTERRVAGSTKDRGDIAGIPGVVIEAKNAARIDLHTWIVEAETERVNDGAAFGVVWAKRKGKTSAADGYIVMTGEQFAQLLRAAGYGTPIPVDQADAA